MIPCSQCCWDMCSHGLPRNVTFISIETRVLVVQLSWTDTSVCTGCAVWLTAVWQYELFKFLVRCWWRCYCCLAVVAELLCKFWSCSGCELFRDKRCFHRGLLGHYVTSLLIGGPIIWSGGVCKSHKVLCNDKKKLIYFGYIVNLDTGFPHVYIYFIPLVPSLSFGCYGNHLVFPFVWLVTTFIFMPSGCVCCFLLPWSFY